MGRLYLVRHGQASLLDDDYDRLSPLGERQSRRVGEWLAPRVARPAVAVSGLLRRQAGTLRACMDAARWDGAEAQTDPGFDEYSHHDLFAQAYPQLADPAAMGAHLRASAQPRREFQSLFEQAFARWLDGKGRAGGGLTWRAFRERCMASLQRVAERCGPGQCALVVTSGGPIAAICQQLLGLPDTQVPLLHTPLFNASVTTLLTRPGEISLSSFNGVAHLELEPAGERLLSYR